MLYFFLYFYLNDLLYNNYFEFPMKKDLKQFQQLQPFNNPIKQWIVIVYTCFYGFRIINATFDMKCTNQSAVDDAHNTCGHQDSPEVQTCD